jgi:hypothetical protein
MRHDPEATSALGVQGGQRNDFSAVALSKRSRGDRVEVHGRVRRKGNTRLDHNVETVAHQDFRFRQDIRDVNLDRDADAKIIVASSSLNRNIATVPSLSSSKKYSIKHESPVWSERNAPKSPS